MVHLCDDDKLLVCVWLAALDLPQMILTMLTNQDIRPKQDAVMSFRVNFCNIAPHHSALMTNDNAPLVAHGPMKEPSSRLP